MPGHIGVGGGKREAGDIELQFMPPKKHKAGPADGFDAAALGGDAEQLQGHPPGDAAKPAAICDGQVGETGAKKEVAVAPAGIDVMLAALSKKVPSLRAIAPGGDKGGGADGRSEPSEADGDADIASSEARRKAGNEPKPCKVMKRPAAAAVAASRKQKEPHFSVEWSRSQVMCRTGAPGKGGTHAIKFEGKKVDEALEQARKWVAKKKRESAH